jgi:hypothetical protein
MRSTARSAITHRRALTSHGRIAAEAKEPDQLLKGHELTTEIAEITAKTLTRVIAQ